MKQLGKYCKNHNALNIINSVEINLSLGGLNFFSTMLDTQAEPISTDQPALPEVLSLDNSPTSEESPAEALEPRLEAPPCETPEEARSSDEAVEQQLLEAIGSDFQLLEQLEARSAEKSFADQIKVVAR